MSCKPVNGENKKESDYAQDQQEIPQPTNITNPIFCSNIQLSLILPRSMGQYAQSNANKKATEYSK